MDSKRPDAREQPLEGEAMLAFWLAYARAYPGYDGMDALEAEAAHLMRALAWAYEHARPWQVLALAQALRLAWYVRGRRTERLRIYTWAVQAAEAVGDLAWQRWAAHQLAETQRQLGRLEEARTGFEQALALACRLGDLTAELDEVHSLAVLDRQVGRLAEARAGFARGLALARRLGNPKDECDEAHELAVLDDEMGQWEQARAGFERALSLALQLGDPAAEAIELCNLGLLLCEAHHVERGRAMIERSLAINERLSDAYWAGKCHQFLARLEKQQDNRSAAIAHYREALRRFEQIHSPDAEDVRAQLRALGARM